MTLLAHHHPAAETQAPPVVLLHGFTSSATTDFAGWAEHLAAAGRTCLAIELPGHGGNAALGEPIGTEAVVAKIRATIDSYLPSTLAEQIDVVGYSLGARLAWELPNREPRIRRLVLGGLSPMEPFTAVTAQDLLDAAEGTAAPSQNPLVDMLAGMISAPDCDTASLARLAEGLGREPFTPETDPPQCPTLLIAGADDQMTQGVETLVQTAGATLATIPGDHHGALHSEEFRRAAMEFFD